VKLQPYPEYKDTDVQWLGKVPSHWNMLPLKAITTLRSQKGRTDLPLLSVYRDYGVIRKDSRDDNHNRDGEDLSTYKIVKPGYLVVNKMKAWQGSLGVSKYDGIVSPAYIVCELKGDVNNQFIQKLLRSSIYITAYNHISYGVRVGQWDMRYNDFKSIPIFIPQIDEQIKIAKFLDYKTSLITRFIRDKKRIIELLKEQKQAIINDAVTGKIDVRTGKQYTKYKESNVEWLREVPNDWNVKPIKRMVRFNPSKTETGLPNNSDKIVVFLPMEKVSVDGILDCSEKRKFNDVCSGFSYFRKDDVVVAKITPCFENGKGAFLNELESVFGFGTTEFITLRPSNQIHGKYLRYLLASKWFLKIAEKYMAGSAGQKRISTNFIANFPIGLADFSTQEKIVDYINFKSEKYDLAISRTEREISLIQEYRTRLIADVVTGKIDVRSIKVPDIVEVDTTLEEITDTNDSEIIAEDELVDVLE
jgi:type I restriction enzyme S subunit